MSDSSSQATLKFSEELLYRPPEQRNEVDILRILPWIRHKSPLFKNLEDDSLVYVIKHVEFIKIKKDHVIVRQGEKGNCFYVILKGSVSVYAKKQDDHHSDYNPQHDMGAVRSTQERLAYFGTELGGLKSGRSFGEMVLMSDKKERNATAIADELTELIIINEELFKKSFHLYNLEWKKKSNFALAFPLFNSWPTVQKALLIENLKMHKIQFGNRVVEQGCPCNSIYFIEKGAGKVLSDPRKCKEQYKTLNPKRREKKNGDEEEKIELNAIEDLVRPLTVIEKRRRRLEHGFVAIETRLRQREIQAATIGPNDVIGDVEMILDIPEYCTSVECVETLEVYELDAGSFQRLIARRCPETLELLKKVVVTKLRLRVERFNEIPLFKYLLERATAFPQKAKTKAIRHQQKAAMGPLMGKGPRKAVKTSVFVGGQTLKRGEVKNKLEKKAETTYKEKEQNSSEMKRRERKRAEGKVVFKQVEFKLLNTKGKYPPNMKEEGFILKEEGTKKQFTSEEFRALKKKMQARGKMI